MKRFKLMSAVALAVAATVFVAAAPAQAGSDYAHAQYQVAFSLNCVGSPTSPPPCAQIFGLGGIWGWIALQSNGTGSAEVTDCGHTGPGGGSGSAGAGHVAYDLTWTTITSPTPPSPVTPVDPNGKYIVFTDAKSIAMGLPPMPASLGHYSVSFMGAKGQETIAP